jgi:hypothetical protein
VPEGPPEFPPRPRRITLFASGLQRSDVLTEDAVADALSRTVRQFGVSGCVGLMAQEFGDHPDTATDRMRWIRQLVDEMPARPAVSGIRHAA